MLVYVANPLLLPEPGGYLQWSEPDLAAESVECARPGIKVDDLQYLVEWAKRVASRSVQHGMPA